MFCLTHYYNWPQEWLLPVLFLNDFKTHTSKKNFFLITLRLCHIFSFSQEHIHFLDVDKQ